MSAPVPVSLARSLRRGPLAVAGAAALALACATARVSEQPRDGEVAMRTEAQRVGRLEREVERLRHDLAEAEQALVAAESGLRQSYTRAEVVSAAAEARIEVERASAQLPWNPQLVQEARSRLSACEEHLQEGHLSAAMYFATRAARTAQGALAEAEAATADPDARRVAGGRVNLRSGPSLEDAVVRTLDEGTPVFPEGKKGDWTHVRTLRGQTGWIHDSLLAPN